MLIALRDDIRFTRIHSGIWADRLEIIAIKIEITDSKKIMLCVYYRSPRWKKPYLDEWLGLFTLFLETTTCYEKIIITGDFNFPDLIWNSELVPAPIRNISSGSAEFRELTLDSYFEQMNMFPTRLNNILDLVFTNSPEAVTNLSCTAANNGSF